MDRGRREEGLTNISGTETMLTLVLLVGYYHTQSFAIFHLLECEANDTNKLEKALVDILSDIQTPQLHQQVNIFNIDVLFKIMQFLNFKNQLTIIFHLHQL